MSLLEDLQFRLEGLALLRRDAARLRAGGGLTATALLATQAERIRSAQRAPPGPAVPSSPPRRRSSGGGTHRPGSALVASPTMRISRELYDEIVAHAREEAPNECCGMIASRDGRALVVHRATNTAASPLRYEIDGGEQYAIQTRDRHAPATTSARSTTRTPGVLRIPRRPTSTLRFILTRCTSSSGSPVVRRPTCARTRSGTARLRRSSWSSTDATPGGVCETRRRSRSCARGAGRSLPPGTVFCGTVRFRPFRTPPTHRRRATGRARTEDQAAARRGQARPHRPGAQPGGGRIHPGTAAGGGRAEPRSAAARGSTFRTSSPPDRETSSCRSPARRSPGRRCSRRTSQWRRATHPAVSASRLMAGLLLSLAVVAVVLWVLSLVVR